MSHNKSSLFTDEELEDVARRQREIDGVKARLPSAYAERLAELVGADAAAFAGPFTPEKAKAIAGVVRPLLPLAHRTLDGVPEPWRTILFGFEALIEGLD